MQLTDTDLATLIGRRFLERRDVKAVQQEDGSYMPDRTRAPRGQKGDPIPWKMQDIRDHIDGKATYGHYLVSPDGMCRLFVFDIDLTDKGSMNGEEIRPRDLWLHGTEDDRNELRMRLRGMADGLAGRATRLLDIPVAIAYSGSKGLHVYGFTGSIPAADARAAALEVLDSFEGCFEPAKGKNFWKHTTHYEMLEIEVYPKQDTVREGDGLGNLVRLPLGVNRKTGQRGFFLDIKAGFPEFKEDDPVKALQMGTFRG